MHVDIPKDITAQMGEFIYPKEVNLPTYKPTINYNKKTIKKAMDAIANAKNHYYICGGGSNFIKLFIMRLENLLEN